MAAPARLVLALLASLALAPAGSAQQDPARLVVIDADASELAALRSRLGLDVVSIAAEGGVSAVARGKDLAALDALGLTYAVAIPDLSAHYAARLVQGDALAASGPPGVGAGLVPPFAQGSMGGYYTWDEVVSILDQFRANHPALVSARQSIGTTLEGRDIWAVKISDNPELDENEPEVRFDSLHHAREPAGMQTLIWFMAWALENYGRDPLATYLVNEREIWCIPVVNADGFVWNQTTDPLGGGMWRKNRRDNLDGEIGVDLNRNYPFQWGIDDEGSSPFTSSEVYRGPSPVSEPETVVMTSFFASRDFRTALSIHCHGNKWLEPWGYVEAAPPDGANYAEISALATELNGYLAGPGSIILYVANGITIDTDVGVHGTMSWTPEIGNSTDGFWPETDRIEPLAVENLPALQRTALAAGAYARIEALALADEGDADGDFDPGETVGFTVTARNSGREATSGPVTVTLSTSGPDASIVDGSHDFGSLASFTSVDNAGSPLRLAIDAGASSGATIEWALELVFEGYSQTSTGSLVVGTARPIAVDDVEMDFPWFAGLPSDTASTGIWERGDPIGTTSSGVPASPEEDATVAGTQAWITGNGGGSAGDDDVDDGFTELRSPMLDLSDMGPVVLGYARWYADLSSQDDSFEIAISNDGGQSWTPLESVVAAGGSWNNVEFLLPTVLEQTDEMQLSFIASDDPNNSVVEAGVDDLFLRVYDERSRALVYGTPALDEMISFNVTGEVGAAVTWFLSVFPADLPLPGFAQPLGLDPNNLQPFLLGNVPAGGLFATPLQLPDDAALTGLTVYFQALVVDGGAKELTNRQQITLE